MPVKKLRDYLDTEHIKYVTLRHSKAYTAQEIAASAHVPGGEMAKTVLVKLDGKMAMAVLPASHLVDFDQLAETSGAEHVELATEEEFKDLFPGCEVGAMPPFGNLYGMETYVADRLADDEEIVFNAGSHTELIRMSFEDFRRSVQPKVMRFAMKPV